jgi:transposase
MPGYHNKFPEGTAEKMSELLKTEAQSRNLRRIQCIFFRAKWHYSAEQIASMTGFHPQTVREIHSNFIKYGEEAIFLKSSGGRIRENMSLEKEKEFLNKFVQSGASGQVLEISKIHEALEKELGRKVPKASTYNLLHRHGWRKISPRPHHPKENIKQQESFKKTLWIWSKVFQ